MTMNGFGFFARTRATREKLEQHRLRLYRIAYSWTHNRALADDLTQETLAKALRNSAQLRDHDAGAAWLYRILANCYHDHFRHDAGAAWLYRILANCYHDHFRRTREMEEIAEETLIEHSGPEQESGARQLMRKVRAAIARLPEGQRQVVTLVDMEGFSYVEVAQILDVPIGTVMSRLCRARGVLKEWLRAELAPAAAAPEAKIRRIK